MNIDASLRSTKLRLTGAVLAMGGLLMNGCTPQDLPTTPARPTCSPAAMPEGTEPTALYSVPLGTPYRQSPEDLLGINGSGRKTAGWDALRHQVLPLLHHRAGTWTVSAVMHYASTEQQPAALVEAYILASTAHTQLHLPESEQLASVGIGPANTGALVFTPGEAAANPHVDLCSVV